MFVKKIILFLIFIAFLLFISPLSADENTTSLNADDNITQVTLKAPGLSTTYASGKCFKIKVSGAESKKPMSNVKVNLKIYTGKKYKKAAVTTDSNGVAKYPASHLKIGKHKVIVSTKYSSKAKISSIKVSKAKLTIHSPKVKNTFNKKGVFKVVVKNRESKKPMKRVKVSIKVFTGNKYRKYSLKTNKNGIVTVSTKLLAKGLHKVQVSVKPTSKIKSSSSKSSIKIVKNHYFIKLKVNGKVMDVKLQDNAAAKALLNKLKKGDITLHAEEYGGFEKVGKLGFSLPANDRSITTSSGDIVLYLGNEISINYASNTWEYTKIGKIQNVKSRDLKNILGSGDVVCVFSLK